MLVWLCVAIRILANPFSNVFQKMLTRQQAEPLFIVCATHGLLSIVCLPFCLFELPFLPVAFWYDMLLCTVLAVAGNVLLVEAMKRSDLSVLGPINAYKSVVSLLVAWLMLGELPSWLGFAGIALIVSGSFGLSEQSHSTTNHPGIKSLLTSPGVRLRFAALLLSATEAVVFKRAMLETSAQTAFTVWAVLGFVVAWVAARLKLGRSRFHEETLRFGSHLGTYLLLFLSTGLMQFCTAVTLEQMQVGSTLALFQISTLLSVILGHRLFQESHFLKRFAGAVVMVAGAVLIVCSR